MDLEYTVLSLLVKTKINTRFTQVYGLTFKARLTMDPAIKITSAINGGLNGKLTPPTHTHTPLFCKTAGKEEVVNLVPASTTREERGSRVNSY